MYCNNFKNWKYSLLILLFYSQISNSSELKSNITSQSLTVGDRLSFQVAAIVPKGASVTPPPVDNGMGNIVIKGWNTFKGERDSSDSVMFSYVITTYVPERCTIPSLPFIVHEDQKSDTLHTQPIPLEVKSVIPADTVDIKGLKAQYITGHAPLWWVWASMLLLIIAISIIFYKYFFTKKQKTDSPKPLLPPYEEAIAAINELERKKHLLHGLFREYVYELSEIFKRYIERRFSINASEFTTEEMIAWLGISGLDTKLKQSVQWFFRTSDPIKFAKQIPDEITTTRFMKETMEFLDATRPLLQNEETVQKSQSSNSPELLTTKSDVVVAGEKNEI